MNFICKNDGFLAYFPIWGKKQSEGISCLHKNIHSYRLEGADTPYTYILHVCRLRSMVCSDTNDSHLILIGYAKW